MNVEIERKYLIRNDSWKKLGAPVLIRQGYLSSDPSRIVRVRIEGSAALLTIKGRSIGATRSEWEYPLPLMDAEKFLNEMCERPLIEKYRTRIPFGGLLWEVDEFLGDNQGLIIAEVELLNENQAITKPDWVGDEVTSDPRYFNSNLLRKPFSQW